MKKGFYTALGTPIDLQGNFNPESMARQIEQQAIHNLKKLSAGLGLEDFLV